jgi:hypothetical protein
MSAEGKDNERLTVRVPDELPVLTPRASRILLDILVDLTTIEVPEEPHKEVTRDC